MTYWLKLTTVFVGVFYFTGSAFAACGPGRLLEKSRTYGANNPIVFVLDEIRGADGKPTDILSRDPFIHVQSARMEGSNHHKVYIKGPRNNVLRHLLVIKNREAETLGLDFYTWLAKAKNRDVEEFLMGFPIEHASAEIPELTSLLTEVDIKVAELALDAKLSQFDDEVSIEVAFDVQLTRRQPPLNPPWWRVLRRGEPEMRPTPGDMLLSHLERSRLTFELRNDKQEIVVFLSGTRWAVTKQLYDLLDRAKSYKVLPEVLPRLEESLGDLNFRYPPSRAVFEHQQRLVANAKLPIVWFYR